MSSRTGRSWIAVSLALSVLITALLGGRPALDQAAAQDATPAVGLAPIASPAAIELGVTVEYLSNGTGGEVGDAVLELVRITILPGAAIPSTMHPGSALIFVEQGSVEVSTTDGAALDLVESTSAGAFATETPDGCKGSCPLETGDSVVLADKPTITVRNTGAVPAVLLVSSVVPRGSGRTVMFCDRAC
jgi:hypothetical protein